MYLKRLDILGFKTFAEKTELLFTPGITAVVGPNGSGKSNIADAILWVLGEGNVRSLRGQSSQDVIFAGNDRRRPLGMAEVSLTIDNSARILPLEFSEVTVTRRVYRSGEGECFINRVPCRLRDIVELFMDTGLSRDAYSLVSQSEIDAILSVRSEDRRAIFEEAAGIKKYRHRKREALRKLESTRQNLLRVHDIVAELEAQLGPLTRQAQVARRYQELSGRLRELELAWLGVQLRRLLGERDRLGRLVTAIGEERAGVEGRLEEVRREERRLREALAVREAEAQQVREQETRMRATLAEAETALALLAQRRATGERRLEQLSRELVELKGRIEAAAQRAEAAEAERGVLIHRIRELKQQHAERKAELGSAGEALEAEGRALEEQRSRMLELARRQAGARNQRAQLERQAKALGETVARLGEERDQDLLEAERLSTAISEAERRAAVLAEAVVEDEQVLETLKLEAEAALSQWEAAARAARDAEAAWRQAAARHAALAEMQESHQGYEEAVRFCLGAARNGRLPGSYRLLGDALHVPEGLEAAVEAALGPLAQAIVAPTTAEALAAARLVRESRAGRVALLSLELVNGAPSAPVPAAACSVLGRAPSGHRDRGERLADRVTADDGLAAAAAALLGATRLVPDLEAAVESVACRCGGASSEAANDADAPDVGCAPFNAVTPDGDLVTAWGILLAGQSADPNSRARALLARRRELEALAAQAQQLEGAHRQAQERAHLLDTERERLRLAREERSRALEKDRAEHAAVLCELERLRADLQRAQRQVERATRQLASARQEQERARAERESLQVQLEAIEAEGQALEAAIARRQAELAQRTRAHREREGALTELRVELAGLEERANAAAAAVQRAIDSRTQAERQLQARVAEQTTLEAELARFDEEHQALRRRQTELAAQLEASAGEQEALRKQIAMLREQSQAVSKQSAAESDRRAELVERAHRAEVEQTAAELELNHLAAHLRQEYELAPEQLEQVNDPEVASALLQSHADPAGEIARLRRQIKALGAVNPEAISEHARLSERHAFLMEQRADLETAQEQLHEAIREIDATTRQTFMDAFCQIGTAFDEMFRRLFGGGRTELVLTDPQDVLETGIEVIVQPPGKKLQNLLLLSGGERALTAMAMLFALMKARPSPFCVLDEVDAPLDEANVGRFTDLLREFAQQSQFILITHNRGTMEAADTLYGVTMEEPGVSRIVSVRLAQIAGENAAETNVDHRHPLATRGF